jgi:hypothetical protein
MFPRTVLLLACYGLPFAAQAGGSDADVASAWLLRAFLLAVMALVLLFAGAFATRLLVWPRLASLPGILAVVLLAGLAVVVFGVVLLLSTKN